MLSFLIAFTSEEKVESPGLPALTLSTSKSLILKGSRLPTIQDCVTAAKNLGYKNVKLLSRNQLTINDVGSIPTTAKEYLDIPIVLGA